MKKTKKIYETEIIMQTTCGATTTIRSMFGKEGIFCNYNPDTGLCNINIDDEGNYVVVNLNNVCFATVRPLGPEDQ